MKSPRSIKVVQWASTVMLVLSVALLMVLGTYAVLTEGAPDITEVTKLGGMLILFVGPEKLAAFFGPVLKRRQGSKNE